MDDELKVFNPAILLSSRGGIENESRGSEPQITEIDTGEGEETLLP